MKQILIVMLVLALAIPVFAGVSKTQGEQKISGFLRQIHSNLEGAKENATRVFNKAKTYVTDYPSQFTGNDKKDVEDLEAKLLIVQNAINDLLTEIETKFPGVTK